MVTGAGGGIGRAAAIELARRGATVQARFTPPDTFAAAGKTVPLGARRHS